MKLACALVALVACGKGGDSQKTGEHDLNASPSAIASPSAPVSTADLDAMWKLAPANAQVGVVVSAHGLQLLNHARVDVTKQLASDPKLADSIAELNAKTSAAVGSIDPDLASLGIDANKPFAVFAHGDDGVFVIPLADRDKFIAAVKGTKGDPTDTVDELKCKMLDGRYVCVTSLPLFDTIGKGKLDISPASARGDIEIVGHTDDAQPLGVAAAVQLARGSFTARGVITGIPPLFLAALGPAAKPQLDHDHSGGFGRANIKPALTYALRDSDPKLQALAATITDPMTFTVAGAAADAEVALTDPAPIQAAIAADCSKLVEAGQGSAILDNGVCKLTSTSVGGQARVWVDGKTLRMSEGDGKAAPAVVEPTALATELATNEWQAVFYGRGSYLALRDDLSKITSNSIAGGIMKAFTHVLLFVNEVGAAAKVDGSTLRFVFGVRTGFSYPDAAVDALGHADMDKLISGKAGEVAAPILAAGKGSLVEGDVAAGYYGVMMPAALVGLGAAVAIPALVQYRKHAAAAPTAP